VENVQIYTKFSGNFLAENKYSTSKKFDIFFY